MTLALMFKVTCFNLFKKFCKSKFYPCSTEKYTLALCTLPGFFEFCLPVMYSKQRWHSWDQYDVQTSPHLLRICIQYMSTSLYWTNIRSACRLWQGNSKVSWAFRSKMCIQLKECFSSPRIPIGNYWTLPTICWQRKCNSRSRRPKEGQFISWSINEN